MNTVVWDGFKMGLWRRGNLWVSLAIPVCLWLAGCSAGPASLQDVIVHQNSGLSDVYSVSNHDVDGWTIAVVRKGIAPVTRIYIEGDGRAYISRNQVSGDPTPVNPVALKLALADSREGVVYLARPCQWSKGAECADRTLWTDARFTTNVARRYAKLVEELSAGQPVELIGYSGGAWVAMQVAARVPNVSKVTTLAGNLMPDWVNARHQVTRIGVAPYPSFTRALPVVAYVGVNDTIVEPGVVGAFEAGTGLTVDVIETKLGHSEGWDKVLLP